MNTKNLELIEKQVLYNVPFEYCEYYEEDGKIFFINPTVKDESVYYDLSSFCKVFDIATHEEITKYEEAELICEKFYATAVIGLTDVDGMLKNESEEYIPKFGALHEYISIENLYFLIKPILKNDDNREIEIQKFWGLMCSQYDHLKQLYGSKKEIIDPIFQESLKNYFILNDFFQGTKPCFEFEKIRLFDSRVAKLVYQNILFATNCNEPYLDSYFFPLQKKSFEKDFIKALDECFSESRDCVSPFDTTFALAIKAIDHEFGVEDISEEIDDFTSFYCGVFDYSMLYIGQSTGVICSKLNCIGQQEQKQYYRAVNFGLLGQLFFMLGYTDKYIFEDEAFAKRLLDLCAQFEDRSFFDFISAIYFIFERFEFDDDDRELARKVINSEDFSKRIYEMENNNVFQEYRWILSSFI